MYSDCLYSHVNYVRIRRPGTKPSTKTLRSLARVTTIADQLQVHCTEEGSQLLHACVYMCVHLLINSRRYTALRKALNYFTLVCACVSYVVYSLSPPGSVHC